MRETLYSMPTNGPACLRIARRKRQIWEKVMKVLLTGGSGNLGQTLVPLLLDKGDTPVILDVRAPRDLKKGALFIEGSILDRPKLTDTFRGRDCVVHIAAWHGIHESRGEKNSYDFFDLNVRGTFEVFEAAASLGIDKIIFISTTQCLQAGYSVRAQQDPGRIDCRGLQKAHSYERDYPSPARIYPILGPRRVRPL
jgi:nucleoside-diphosphate-sugar epimerase